MKSHVQNRALERYNLNLTKDDENKILELIKDKKSIFLEKSKKNEKMIFCYVTYKNIPLKVLYLRSRGKGVKSIVTIYPFNPDEYNEVVKNDLEDRIKNSIGFLKKHGFIVYKRKNQQNKES